MQRQKIITLAMLVTASFLFVLASGTATQGEGYGIITTDELFNMLKSKDFTLVNVYAPYEGELPQTDAFIPYDRVDQCLDQLPADKDAKIVLYCKMGKKSLIAAERLAELGYTNVWGLKGGMAEWRQKDYPIINASFMPN